MKSKSKVSPVIFIASVLCFLLPFVTVSCGEQKVASFSGVQLATGTTVEQPQMFGPPQKQKVDPDPTAALVALCAILGVALSLAGTRIALAPAISGAVGAVSLFVMKARLEDQVVRQGHGMLQVSYESGFSLALLLFVAGTVWNGYLYSQRNKAPAASPPEATESTMQSGSPQPSVCPQCGQSWVQNAKFCMHCGKPASDTVTTGSVNNG